MNVFTLNNKINACPYEHLRGHTWHGLYKDKCTLRLHHVLDTHLTVFILSQSEQLIKDCLIILQTNLSHPPTHGRVHLSTCKNAGLTNVTHLIKQASGRTVMSLHELHDSGVMLLMY